MPIIKKLFAFVIHDNDDLEDEGLMAFQTQSGEWMPMVGADMDRVDSLIPIANEIANLLQRPYKIATFEMTDFTVIVPPGEKVH